MPEFTISVTNRQRALPIDRRRLVRLARLVLQQEQIVAAEISVAIVDDAAIHGINRQFLNHDFPTDVISFLLDCNVVEGAAADTERTTADPARTRNAAAERKSRTSGELSSRIRRGAAKAIEGEVVISAETASVNAARYGTRPQHELALYLVHGMLHLCGYDDLTPKDKRLMRARESEALARFDIMLPRRRIVRRKDRP